MRWSGASRHGGREFGTLAGLLLLCVGLWVATPHFATLSNLINVIEQSTIIGIVAVGMTFVIISGGIDLSVGSIVALSGIVLGMSVHRGLPMPGAVLLALAVGASCGAVNGILVTAGRLPPFIATLGMMSVARGASLLLADGRPVSGYPASVRGIATGHVFGVPAPVILMIAVYALAHLVLTRTTFGRYAYAVGGNEDAARVAGVNVRRWKTAVYGVSGMLAATASVVLVARLNSAQPVAGMSYELDAIAAVVIGGASLLGGMGSVTGTLIGALTMSVLRNGLNLLGVSSYLQQIAIGTVIIAAVVVDMALRRRQTAH